MGSPLTQWLAALCLTCTLAYPLPAHSKTKTITLAQATTKLSRTEIDLPRLFRSEITRQLQTIEFQQVRQDEALVLSASLVELETLRTGNRAKSSCVVSATLRKKNGGALVAILRGKARAEDAFSAKSENEIAALRAAVRSTLRGIPTALP
jgi:Xaa-Pro aminopeptidase